MTPASPEMAPREPQESSRGPKTAPGWPKMAPRWLRDGPRVALQKQLDSSLLGDSGLRCDLTLERVVSPMLLASSCCDWALPQRLADGIRFGGTGRKAYTIISEHRS